MKEGFLCYNNTADRYFIFFYDGGRPLDLHCGDTFWVLDNNEWMQTHIEYDHEEKEWYLPDWLLYRSYEGSNSCLIPQERM
jgi:hypothetical protein